MHGHVNVAIFIRAPQGCEHALKFNILSSNLKKQHSISAANNIKWYKIITSSVVKTISLPGRNRETWLPPLPSLVLRWALWNCASVQVLSRTRDPRHVAEWWWEDCACHPTSHQAYQEWVQLSYSNFLKEQDKYIWNAKKDSRVHELNMNCVSVTATASVQVLLPSYIIWVTLYQKLSSRATKVFHNTLETRVTCIQVI